MDATRTGTTGTDPAVAWDLFMLVRRESGGPLLAVERVVRRDLLDPRWEYWFDAWARRGAPDVHVDDVAVGPAPLYLRGEDGSDGDSVCVGFDLSGEGADGRPARSTFYRSCLPTARRAARKLLEAGTLQPGDTYHYELYAERAAAGGPGETARPSIVVSRGPSAAPLEPCREPLGPLLDASEHVTPPMTPDATGTDDYPVFYTHEAHAAAERAARQGAASEPAVETGGLLVGRLGSCPDTGELFAVVEDVLVAAHAEATTHSLTFSDRTWAGFQDEMRARAGRPRTRHQRILGQVHGHSFLPLDGAPPCEACATREVCTRTTAFLSEDDLAFCRSLFAGQPWQLSHVFGLDAMGRGVEGFYGQKHGELVRRGYRLVDHP